MKKRTTLTLPDLEVLYQPEEDADVASAYTSDLLSDVMAHAEADSLLITIQAHKNTVAVATLVNAVGIILCNNRPVPEDMLEAARQEKTALYRSGSNQFEVSCQVRQWLDAP